MGLAAATASLFSVAQTLVPDDAMSSMTGTLNAVATAMQPYRDINPFNSDVLAALETATITPELREFRTQFEGNVQAMGSGLNDIYLKWLKDNKYDNKGIGNYIFNEYISDIITVLSSEINFTYLILHAYNDPKVIEAYRRMGFETMEDDAEAIVPVLSDVRALHYDYAGDCKFMFKDVESILAEVDRRNEYV